MANPSPVRIAGVGDRRPVKMEVPLGKSAETLPKVAEVSPVSPRRLVRPGPSARTYAAQTMISHAPLLSRALYASGFDPLSVLPDTSHAETFYLQKQVQAKTLMVFVLDDGEHIEGYMEWYDRNVVKVRHGGSRTLIYKCCIKYLYKAGENGHV